MSTVPSPAAPTAPPTVVASSVCGEKIFAFFAICDRCLLVSKREHASQIRLHRVLGAILLPLVRRHRVSFSAIFSKNSGLRRVGVDCRFPVDKTSDMEGVSFGIF